MNNKKNLELIEIRGYKEVGDMHKRTISHLLDALASMGVQLKKLIIARIPLNEQTVMRSFIKILAE